MGKPNIDPKRREKEGVIQGIRKVSDRNYILYYMEDKELVNTMIYFIYNLI